MSLGGSFARTGLPQAVGSASYNAANQLTQRGASALSYDLNGNLTSDGVNTLTWDARNQLVSISGTTTGTFEYDGLGRRTHPARSPLSLNDARMVWNKLVERGLNPRFDLGHPRSPYWNTPHVNIPGTGIHIPVDPRFTP